MKRGLALVHFLTPAFLLFASCGTSNNAANVSKRSHSYVLKDADMDGEPVQVLKSQSGLSIVLPRSNVSIQFGTNGQILVEFDEKSLKPKNVLLKTIGPSGKLEQSVWDANADGIPDGRYLFGENGEKATQIFFHGSWYYKRNAGTNAVIFYEGKPLNLFFDGTTWRQNTNTVSTPQSGPSSPDLGMIDATPLGL